MCGDGSCRTRTHVHFHLTRCLPVSTWQGNSCPTLNKALSLSLCLSLPKFLSFCNLFPYFHLRSYKLELKPIISTISLPLFNSPQNPSFSHLPLHSCTHPFSHPLFALLFLEKLMAAKLSLILCVVAIWAIDLAHGHGGSSSHHAPAPSVDCSSLVLTMADCLSFVTNGSTTTKPEGTCCSGLKSVLKTAPACLCEAFKSSAQFGVVLNVTKATSLPAACKVSAPSATNCGLSETPATAPAGSLSPQSSSTSTPAAPGLNGPISEQSPAPAPSLGNAASALFPISAGSLFVCLLVAVFSGF